MKRTLVAVLVSTLLVVACGGSDGSDAAQNDALDESTNLVDITMQDYAFAVEGQPAAGPLTVMFHNDGDDIHHGILGQIDDDKTFEDVRKAIDEGLDGPPPPWFDDSPPDMTLVSPGESSGVTFNAEPGRYVLLCFMPGPENKPHYEHGMFQTFDVAPAAGADAPEPDASLSMTQEGIDAPERLSPGTSVIEVTNDSDIDMEAFVISLAEGKSLDDIEPYFNKGLQGPPPATFFGGTHTFPPGETVSLLFDLEPGDYQIVASFEDEDGEIQDLPTDFTVD